MKILQINKFFYPRGGTETYLFGLIDLLEKNGHQTVVFSQAHSLNRRQPAKQYTISNLELSRFHWRSAGKVGRIFWSREAQKIIKEIISREKPDLVHIHNIYHQISPSILPVIKQAGIPIVMTVHDFKLVKHDYALRADQQRRHKPLLFDWLLRLEFLLHRALDVYAKNVDLFIAPSQFVKNRLVEKGYPEAKIAVVPHFVDNIEDNNINPKIENYILFLGRLDETKGADLLVAAIAKLKRHIRVKIAGSGPQYRLLKEQITRLNLSDRIQLLGKQNNEQIKGLIRKSLFVVFPSRVHETFGLSIVESQLGGKAVAAARVGATPELITDNETGILFKAGDSQALAQTIDFMLAHPERTALMGRKAKELAQKRYSAETHYAKIISIYKQLTDEK
ncbi:MAG TPA: glycosyltransferase family 4 protein [bacterium]|nr:glycosyltransferase family 4 protein [bacterium]